MRVSFNIIRVYRMKVVFLYLSLGALVSETRDKPDKVLINPEPKLDNGSLTVREDDTIGPFNCSADCNPPCKIKWRYKDTADKIYDASSNGHELGIQKVNRDMSEFRCVAIYEQNEREKYNIVLNVQYLIQPLAYINGKQVPQRISAYQISEAEAVNLSCYVNSKPLSHIKLTKDIGSTISEEESSDWLNHSIESSQCSDTGTYKCTGLSTGFNNTEKTFELNVTCKYLMTRFFYYQIAN
uniref:Uncharacterized protein LOC111113619 n=1 Tax=Crassostrea virginica TaxID=6565 RepID=A0A8B8BXN5_CRAVI|nr:uncharacterized protein LOC111113619 [Crassostrea virginica]